MHFAAREGRAEITRVLLEYGVDPTVSGSNGTALEVATTSRKAEVVEILTAHAEGNVSGWKEAVNVQEGKNDDTNESSKQEHSFSAFSHDLVWLLLREGEKGEG